MNLASTTATRSIATLSPEHLNSMTHQRLLDALAKRPMTAPELRRDLGLADSCVSLGKCLSELMDSGRVVRRRLEGTHVYNYSLSDSVPTSSSNVHFVAPSSEVSDFANPTEVKA